MLLTLIILVMKKILKTSYSAGIEVVIDILSFEEIVGKRVYELLPQLIEKVIEECFIETGVGRPDIEEGVQYIRLFKRAPRSLYGYVESKADFLEKRIYARFATLDFVATAFKALEPLKGFNIANYVVKELEGRDRSPEGYRLTARLVNILYYKIGLPVSELGYGRIGLAIEDEPEEELSVVVREKYTLKLVDVKPVDPVRDSSFLQKLVNRLIREKLRILGFKVQGQTVYEKYSLIETGKVEVLPGFEFQTYIGSDGKPVLFLSPKHLVSSTKTLWEEYGSMEALLKAKEELLGIMVRRVIDNVTFMVEEVLPVKACEPLPDGTIVAKFYEEQVSSDEPVIVVSRGGAKSYAVPSILKRVYDMKALAKLGLAKEVLKKTRIRPSEWVERASKIVEELGVLEKHPVTVIFSPKPLSEVELYEVY